MQDKSLKPDSSRSMSEDESNEKRLAAQRAMINPGPDEDDIWVFGYGSLLWNPGFEFEERRTALVQGYHRAFCVYSEYYRGTAAQPGLVLGLDRGGSCRGVAYRLSPKSALATLDYLWEREMIYNVYEPRILNVKLSDTHIRSRTFVANRNHSQYAGRLSMAEKSRLIQRGSGVSGANREYLENTLSHLEEIGVTDGALKRLAHMVAQDAA